MMHETARCRENDGQLSKCKKAITVSLGTEADAAIRKAGASDESEFFPDLPSIDTSTRQPMERAYRISQFGAELEITFLS